MSQTLIRTEGLQKCFKVPNGWLHAVDGVDLEIRRGETLGVVGESGCGKSTLGRAILRLHEPTGGKVFFEDANILSYSASKMDKLRPNMQIIFQDPYSSLNPRMTVQELIAEPLHINKVYRSKRQVYQRVAELMEIVGLAERLTAAYPHELDGGRRQRIGVARALALNPKFIVCDEPVSALDVSIQAQIINLLMDLQDEFGLTYLFITHDLSVVKHISNDIMVMYMGVCVERASSDELFHNPTHPYTKALLSAIPIPDIDRRLKPVDIIKGEVTNPVNPKPGCRFAPRCPHCSDKCLQSAPELRSVGEGHLAACIKAGSI